MNKAAYRAPEWVRHVSATKWSAPEERRWRYARKLGSHGAASKGRIIMKNGKLIDPDE
jgi:hypothetical protein